MYPPIWTICEGHTDHPLVSQTIRGVVMDRPPNTLEKANLIFVSKFDREHTMSKIDRPCANRR
jgi:hypothetical protein